MHSSLGYRTPIEYENAYYNGGLTIDDQPADQAVDPELELMDDVADEQDDQRDQGRDINPRTYADAG